MTGVTVTFSAPGSGASGTFPGSAISATALTNASGIATAPAFTANATTGAFTVAASVSGVASPANFALTNAAPLPGSVTVSAGSPQTATINAAFATALQVIVRDTASNPMSGVTVTFTSPGSGASGTFPGASHTASAVTNGSGVATAPAFTASSTAGGYLVAASVSGVATAANFSLTNAAGPAASVAANAGTPQSTNVSTGFPTALQAVVRDAGSNPVSGVTVTFTAPGAGASGTFLGSSATATAITNASGIASAPAFTANGTRGSYAVNASVAGVALPAGFALTNLAPGTPPTPPVISPNALFFTANLGDPTPPPAQNLSISAAGQGTFKATPSTAWLRVTPFLNGLSVSVAPTGLPAGTSFASIAIAFSDGQSALVPVSLTIAGAPVLTSDQASLTFTSNGTSSSAPRQFILGAQNRNTNFSVAPGAPWLNVSSSRSQTPAVVVVSVNIAGMAAGSYQGGVLVTSMEATNSPFSVPVTLNIVLPGPAINAGGLVNGASFVAGPGAPNTIFTAFGAITCSAPEVLVAGQPAEVLGSTSTQVTFTIPPSVAGNTSVSVQIRCNGIASPVTALTLAPVAPAIFTTAQNGSGQAAVRNPDEHQRTGQPRAARLLYVDLRHGLWPAQSAQQRRPLGAVRAHLRA